MFLAAAGLAFWIGFFVLDQRSFTLVFAGMPASALFTVLGAAFSPATSDFLLAWPIDAALWLTLAFVGARRAQRRRLGPRGIVTWIVAAWAVALAYGAVLSLLVEPTS